MRRRGVREELVEKMREILWKTKSYIMDDDLRGD